MRFLEMYNYLQLYTNLWNQVSKYLFKIIFEGIQTIQRLRIKSEDLNNRIFRIKEQFRIIENLFTFGSNYKYTDYYSYNEIN